MRIPMRNPRCCILAYCIVSNSPTPYRSSTIIEIKSNIYLLTYQSPLTYCTAGLTTANHHSPLLPYHQSNQIHPIQLIKPTIKLPRQKPSNNNSKSQYNTPMYTPLTLPSCLPYLHSLPHLAPHTRSTRLSTDWPSPNSHPILPKPCAHAYPLAYSTTSPKPSPPTRTPVLGSLQSMSTRMPQEIACDATGRHESLGVPVESLSCLRRCLGSHLGKLRSYWVGVKLCGGI